MELKLLNGCKSKRILRKKDMLKITTSSKNIFYVDKEKQDTMIEFYLVKRNLKRTISFSFV